MKHISSFVVAGLFGAVSFSGCGSSVENLKSDTIQQYLKNVHASEKGSIKEYVSKKQEKDKLQILISNGSTLGSVLKKACDEFSNQNSRYMFDMAQEKDYTFSEQLIFEDVYQLVEYVNFSEKYPFKLGIQTKGVFKKITISWISDVETKLRETRFETSGDVNSLNEIKDLVTVAGVSYDIDTYSSSVLNQQKPSAFKGSAFDYIKSLTDSSNLYFSVKDNAIKINQFQEKVFDIAITPLSIQSQSKSDLKVVTNTGGTKQDGATGQASEIGFGYKIYDELRESIKSIIGNEGMYHLNQASGQLITRARPQNMELIEKVVKKFNEMYSVQLEIELEIMEVSLNEQHQNGIDFSIAGTTSSFTSAYKTISATSNFATIATDVTKRGTRIQNMIQLLNNFGTVEMTSKPSLKTLNSVPGVISISLDKDYISDVKITPSTTTSAASYDITRDTASDGIKLYVFPRMTNDDRILLTIQPQTSSVLGLDEHNIGGLVTMQTKTVNNREFSNTMSVKNGETTLLAGFLTQLSKKSKYGMPWISEKDSASDYIGGMKSSDMSKSELVLAVTVKVVN